MKKSFKRISLLLALVMVVGLMLAGCGAKDNDPANAAYFTLTNAAELATDKSGNYIAAVAIEVPADGATVGDVLKAAHEKLFKDGANGFATAKSDYGDMITKLWGVENGGAYGYYVNGAMSMGLTDPVKPGDRVDAFIYKDAANYSDAFAYIEASAEGTKVTVKAQAMGFDANWNPVMNPLAGAKIYYANGKNLVDTKAVTGEDGTASFTLKAGTYRIVAIAEGDVAYTVSAQKIAVK